MITTAPWLIPLGIMIAMAFSLVFIGWLEGHSKFSQDAGQVFFAIVIFVLVMALGSLVTLLVI